MRERHLDRLSALDALFLHQEGPQSHMHIGALALCDGPPPALEALLAHIDARLARAPRYRQRLAHTPLDRGRPLWIDDAGFRIEFHVRHAALPSPGARDQLLGLLARIFSTPLDRDRPLWELWFVEGLEAGGFALIFKSHHALIDGVAGVDLATVVFDPERAPGPAAPAPRWSAAPAPGRVELAAAAAASALGAGMGLAAHAREAARHPQAALGHGHAALAGVAAIARQALRASPRTPLNVPIGPHRRYAVTSFGLADAKRIGDAFGGTINDVLLAAVTGALRRFLLARGQPVEGLELHALVPVSLRASAGGPLGAGGLGNRVAAMRAVLPVHLADPLARLDAVRAAMDDAKGSGQAHGAEVLTAMLNLVPAALIAQAARPVITTRFVNLLVTNVPGPQLPLHVLGRRMAEAYPVALLPRNHALSVAALSYDGQLNIGLLADFDALPEADQLAAWVREELATLLAALPA